MDNSLDFNDNLPLLGGQPAPTPAGAVSLTLLADTLTALADDTAQLPAPLDLFARELESGLLQFLGVATDGN